MPRRPTVKIPLENLIQYEREKAQRQQREIQVPLYIEIPREPPPQRPEMPAPQERGVAIYHDSQWS